MAPGRPLSGPVTLTGNQGGAELGGNTISGPVNITGNTGTATSTDSPSSAVELEANSISGPLACSGNSSITDDHQANTVRGPASGQCATGFT